MIFGRVPLADARGGIIAHNLKTADRVIRKGALLDDAAYDLLLAAGYDNVTVLKLEPGDVPEGEAAVRLGQLLLGPWLRRSNDVHGRVNIFAEANGLLRLSTAKIELLNLIDESITLATLQDRSVVSKGDMIATLKIIPFAVSADAMDRAANLIEEGTPAFSVKPFHPLKIGLVLTQLPHIKDVTISHTIEATRDRIEAHGGTLLRTLTTLHQGPPLVAAIKELLHMEADLILISGASAVTDRQDVAPAAIVEAGGQIVHFGMPVDPGNLICFSKIGSRHAIVLPGCARSPKQNGIDWVLDMIFAGEDVGPGEIAKLGVGGLLTEIETRPAPRTREREAGFGTAPTAKPRIAAVVLAAGMSTRMAPHNKLLQVLPSGKTMIAETVDRILESAASPVIIVVGHQQELIKAALAGKSVRFIYAADYSDGLSASLRAGVGVLSDGIGAVLICLGDMPLVDKSTLDQIMSAFNPAEGREILIPVHDGQRGNPVLWGNRFFDDLRSVSGDIGARQILHKYMEYVAEVSVLSNAVIRDFDTREAFETLR
jgi:molybdenum cofactor cytidylyltransferase